MPHFDLPLDELERYRSSVVAPADLDDFWRATLDEALSINGAVAQAFPQADVLQLNLAHTLLRLDSL